MSDVFAVSDDNPLLEEVEGSEVGWYMGLADYVIQCIGDNDLARAFELREIQYSIMVDVIDRVNSSDFSFDEQSYILSKCIGELALSVINSLHKMEMRLEAEDLLNQSDDE